MIKHGGAGCFPPLDEYGAVLVSIIALTNAGFYFPDNVLMQCRNICSSKVQSKVVNGESGVALKTSGDGDTGVKGRSVMQKASCSGSQHCHPTPIPAPFPLFLHCLIEVFLVLGTANFGFPPLLGSPAEMAGEGCGLLSIHWDHSAEWDSLIPYFPWCAQ